MRSNRLPKVAVSSSFHHFSALLRGRLQTRLTRSACTDPSTSSSAVCQDDIMPEDKSCKMLLHTSRSSDNKKKKKKRKKGKKRKKVTASTTPPENNTEKPQAVSLPPETLPVSLLPPQIPAQPRDQLPKLRPTSKKDGERLIGSGRRSKKHPKDSQSLLTTANKTSAKSTAQGYAAELSTQAKESLRWEGVLEDPQAEEKRLELYRANRRQRYISHREALLEEAQHALTQTFPKESKDKKALIGSDQQEKELN